MFRLFSKKQFLKTSAKLIRKNPALEEPLSKTLRLLRDDPFAPSLKTHKLKGPLQGLYACSLTYELRIVFEIKTDSISLIDIGTHDEVY